MTQFTFTALLIGPQLLLFFFIEDSSETNQGLQDEREDSDFAKGLMLTAIRIILNLLIFQ